MSRSLAALIVALILAAAGWSLFGWEVSHKPDTTDIMTDADVQRMFCEDALERMRLIDLNIAGPTQATQPTQPTRPTRPAQPTLAGTAIGVQVGSHGWITLEEARDIYYGYFDTHCPGPTR